MISACRMSFASVPSLPFAELRMDTPLTQGVPFKGFSDGVVDELGIPPSLFGIAVSGGIATGPPRLGEDC